MQQVSFLKRIFLNIYFWPVFLLITLVGMAVLPFILLVNILFFSRTLASGLRRSIRFYGWVLVCLVPFGAPVRVEGDDKFLSPVIFVANHNSAIDPYLFGAIITENAFVTSWPFKIPLYALLMNLAGYVNAGEGWDKVCTKCKKLLETGSSVTIWPEGHRSRDGRLGRFKNGAFALAIETGIPIVPVCILGSGTVLPPGKKFLIPGRVRLIVLDPVDVGDSNQSSEIRIKELRTRVYSAMEQILSEKGHFRQCQIDPEDRSRKKIWI